MKKVAKLFTTLFGIIAVSVIMVFFFSACGDGGDSGGGGGGGGGGDPKDNIPADITIPKVGDLPAFPANSNPATTVQNVNSILAALEQSKVVDYFFQIIDQVVYDNSESDDDDNIKDYNFKDKEDNAKTVKVSASYKHKKEISKNYYTLHNGGYVTPSDYYWRESSEGMRNVKSTGNIPYADCTIIAGSMYKYQRNDIFNDTVTKAGTYSMELNEDDNFIFTGTAKINFYGICKHQRASGFTVITPLGSVKIILNFIYNDGSHIKADSSISKDFQIVSGSSLNVFGKDDVLLLSVPFNSYQDFRDAGHQIGWSSVH